MRDLCLKGLLLIPEMVPKVFPKVPRVGFIPKVWQLGGTVKAVKAMSLAALLAMTTRMERDYAFPPFVRLGVSSSATFRVWRWLFAGQSLSRVMSRRIVAVMNWACVCPTRAAMRPKTCHS